MIALWHRLPDNFEDQLRAIGDRAEAYHFDDGYDDVLRAADALEAMDLRGVFFITTGWIATEGYVDHQMIRTLVERGHEIGNHTETHRLMNELLPDEARRDIAAAQMALADITDRVPRRFAWPHGRHDEMTDAIAAEFLFDEVRDISNVVRRIATKTDAELAGLFPCA